MGLIDSDLARAGDLELSDPSPGLLLDTGHELNALALQDLDRLLDVVAHEKEGMVAGPAAQPPPG